MEGIFKALADEKRRQILDLLKTGPLTTNEIAAYFDISRIGVMKHLDVLERGNLIVIRRKGRQRFNHLNAVPIQMIYKRWMEPFSSFWSEGLLNLKQGIEEIQKEGVVEKIHLELEVDIKAKAATVFQAMTKDISQWWGLPYNISEDISNVVLDARIGGHLYEEWKGGGAASWGIVTQVKEGAKLQITGPIGMRSPVLGLVDFDLEESNRITTVKLSHKVMGDVSDETKKNYTMGWKDLLGVRLKAYVEEGVKYGIGYDLPPGVPNFND